jgi:hypothetical protein
MLGSRSLAVTTFNADGTVRGSWHRNITLP